LKDQSKDTVLRHNNTALMMGKGNKKWISMGGGGGGGIRINE